MMRDLALASEPRWTLGRCYYRVSMSIQRIQRETLISGSGRFLAAALMTVALLAGAGCSQSGEPVALFRAGQFARAFALFEQRAAREDAEAINFLGIHYYLGAGVERDFKRAAQYFQRAALRHDANAQRNLAIMYMRGLGLAQDNHRAYAWFYQSYTGGNGNAVQYLKTLSDNVTPNAAGKAREWVAAEMRQHAHHQP